MKRSREYQQLADLDLGQRLYHVVEVIGAMRAHLTDAPAPFVDVAEVEAFAKAVGVPHDVVLGAIWPELSPAPDARVRAYRVSERRCRVERRYACPPKRSAARSARR